ncbi:hypothetical protein BT96DRAFT_826063 [Gymnopus androsaceus JB14]|uniref:Uncharacterized protein n=1 Tax=Gymnopus androsaceus JB14 TaxID=1447944 RepID=A0A6A4HBG7_9AGAR|nr:hypothetical protein BT96DRAFT_826063 [Gymnopus androsaceus JB14]
MFQEIEGNVDIFPLQDTSSVKPFTSIVVNLNGVTVAHKDEGDEEGCIVIVLGPHAGGGLCLYEPRVVLDVKHGDVVTCRSRDYTHFNLHYDGIRASLVIHSDKTGEAFRKDGNSWDKKIFYL